MGAEYLSDVKSIATFALTFFGYIISVLASVYRYLGNLISLQYVNIGYWISNINVDQ